MEKIKFDKTNEEFIVPPNYMVQLIIEMSAYNKRKAYFGQLYSFKGWYSIASFFNLQYNQIMRGGRYPFRQGAIVYTPCLERDTAIYTMVKRIIKIVENDGDVEKIAAKNMVFK